MRVTIILVLGMLLMSSLKVEVKAYCGTNGCSIPENLSLLYKDRFSSACNKRYICYACVRIMFLWGVFKTRNGEMILKIRARVI